MNLSNSLVIEGTSIFHPLQKRVRKNNNEQKIRSFHLLIDSFPPEFLRTFALLVPEKNCWETDDVPHKRALIDQTLRIPPNQTNLSACWFSLQSPNSTRQTTTDWKYKDTFRTSSKNHPEKHTPQIHLQHPRLQIVINQHVKAKQLKTRGAMMSPILIPDIRAMQQVKNHTAHLHCRSTNTCKTQ